MCAISESTNTRQILRSGYKSSISLTENPTLVKININISKNYEKTTTYSFLSTDLLFFFVNRFIILFCQQIYYSFLSTDLL
jgi:hypothetical protein